jgi:hypothetical protein
MQTQMIPGSTQMPVGFSAQKVAKPRSTAKTTCQQVLDAGGCTLEEFIAELQRQVDAYYDEIENA